MRNKKILHTLICLTILLPILSYFSPQKAYAERVYGAGFYGTLSDYGRDNYYNDHTVEPPLADSWQFTNVSGVPVTKGYALNNYRLYFGQHNTIYGLNDQRGTYSPTQLSSQYLVGNPFTFTYPSMYGNVNTSMEQIWSNSSIGSSENGNIMLFGTNTGMIGIWGGFSLTDQQGNQQLAWSPNTNGKSDLYGGGINYIGSGGAIDRFVAASNYRIHMMNDLTMDRTWYFDITGLSGYKLGDGITGITQLGGSTSGKVMISTDFQTAGSTYGLIFTNSGDDLGRSVSKSPTYTIKFQTGLPKASAYDPSEDTIVSVDKEGRVYYHSSTGVNKIASNWVYAGDSTTTGYSTVGGAAIYNGQVYVSTKSSAKGIVGTITKFSLSDPTQKTVYVHDAPITTTPIVMYDNSEPILFFGDSLGRVFTLDANTLAKIPWYKNSTGTSQYYCQLGTTAIENVQGADNHLIASSSIGIYAWKGRPDYTISNMTYQTSSGSVASLNGARFNYTSSLPVINSTTDFLNQGTFDYDIYTDFGGRNDQKISLQLKDLDENTTIDVPDSQIGIDSTFYNEYKSDLVNSVSYFQIPKHTTVPIQYQFTPREEGRYQLVYAADVNNYQREFNKSNNSSTASFDVVDMNPPTAKSNSTSYTLGQTVTFSLSKTQKFSYSSFNFELKYPDGTDAMNIANQSSFPSSLTFSNLNQKGTYSYRVSINNRYGDTIYGNWQTFNVVNRPPVADFSWNPSTIYNDTTVNFVNNSSDPDNDPLTYQWAYQDIITGSWVSFSTLANPSKIFNLKGTWNIRLTVSDGTASSSVAKAITVQNRPPIANFLWSPSTIYNNTNLAFTDGSTDADKDSLTYQWSYEQPNSSTWVNFSTAQNPTHVLNMKGSWNIQLTVSDGTAYSSITKTVTVQNRPPVPGFTTDKTTYTDKDTVNITSTANDPDGDPLSYSYSIKKPDGTTFTSSVANPSFGGLIVGTYTITQTVTDTSGSFALVTASISVGASNLPPVAGFNFDKTKYYKNDSISVISTASDPNGDPLTYSYQITAPDGSVTTSTNSNLTFTGSMVGTYTVKQTVTDPSGASDSIIKTQWVQSLPTPGFNTDKTSYYKNETVTVTSTAFDEDGGSLTYLYEVTDPNGFKTAYNVANPTFSVSTITGTYSIKQTVTDNEGDTATLTKTIQVVNRPPIANFTWSPSTIFNDTSVTFTDGSSDPDGDKLTYQWAYQQTNSTNWDDFSTAQNPAQVLNIKGNWNIRLTVSDGAASVTISKVVTVQNRPPVANFSWSPPTVYNNTSVTFTNTSTDEDHDSLTYRWEYQSPGTTSWVSFSTAVNPTQILNAKGTWNIRLTASDGTATNSVTQSITVQNRSPKAGFTTDKTSYVQSDTVSVTSTATDPDNDTPSYSYLVTKPDGTTFTATTANFTYNNLQFGTYSIKQTVTDTSGASDSTTNTVTVSNRPPTAVLTVSPSQPYEGDLGHMCVKATDPDTQLLTVKLYVTKDNGNEQRVLNQSNVTSGSTLCYDTTLATGHYDVRTEVSDGMSTATASTSFDVLPLSITVHVLHTPGWEARHQAAGDADDEFYSGEAFVLQADVAPYPIEYVNATLDAVQVDGAAAQRTVPLSAASTILYQGTLADTAFMQYPTTLAKGTATFTFKVKYTNGVIKTSTVNISIIGNVYQAFRLHSVY